MDTLELDEFLRRIEGMGGEDYVCPSYRDGLCDLGHVCQHPTRQNECKMYQIEVREMQEAA